MTFAGNSRAYAGAFVSSLAAVALLVSGPAPAATVTIDGGSTCAAWNWNESTRTLTCGTGGSGPPVCSVTGPTVGTVGVPTTLTASCSPAATSWRWAGGNCADVTTSTCSAVGTLAGAVSYRVTGTNASGTGVASPSYAVTWSTQAPPPSFACSFNPAPGGATAGTALPLTVTCSGGTASTFAWSATAPAGCQGNCSATFGSGAQTASGSNTVTLPSAGIWTVRANVTSTTNAAAQTVASVQASAVVGGGGTNLCAAQGYAKTIYYNWDWSAPVSHLDTIYMSDMAGGVSLGTNGILVVAFKPSGPGEFNNISAVSATGYPAPNMINNLTLAISTQPCDLNPASPATTTSTTPSVSYGIGTVPTYWSTGAKVAVELQPGVQYYLNVASRDQVSAGTPNGSQTCVFPHPGWNCDVRMSLQKPLGH